MDIELGANNLIFTLTEKVTLEDPGFVLILVNDSTNFKCACKLGADLSSYPERFNKFLVTVKTSPVALNSEIELRHLGFHKYYVYEMEDADTFDFSGVDDVDLSEIEGLVEQGKMKYITDPDELPSYINLKPSIKAYGE